ncbi:hypothetical protein FD724_38715 (plasmid) [Nostoc sp. C057]|uniref:hypothetical protein n=1 Tax=Nostoc sp. C057 TaxID=2576903 RepID=UPI0015C356A6|nr:hypothetical protein [Nostoc sp. C057]QLE53777.1 hypothetical protein FD724_38715 [Nostoc sp. C057]
MSDMNDNLDDSIPFLNVEYLNVDSWENLVQKAISIRETKEKGCEAVGYLHKTDYDVLYTQDDKTVYISVKDWTLDKQLESSELTFGSNFSDLLFSKLANFIEITTPKTWNNISFYFHDIVEDHRENLIPDCRRKYGIEWFANCITIWRLLLFFGYFVSRLVKQIITFRFSSL